MKLKFKKLNESAVLPQYAKKGDAGLDLTAISLETKAGYIEYGTGLAVEIPEGYVGLLFPRSSISEKGLILSNSVGVLDSGYRGEIKFRYRPINSSDFSSGYTLNDRIGQLVIMPYVQVNVQETNLLSETERGTGGFGSTNVKEKEEEIQL